MAEYKTIKIVPHEQVLLVAVQPARLDQISAAQLEEEVSHAAIEVPKPPLVLDISKVKFAPSVALGVLVNLFKGMRLANRPAFLVGPSHQIRGTLAVTRLDELIGVRKSLDDVLAQL